MPGSRAFVRPSGTEDVLRLYVEASTMEDVEKMAANIIKEIELRYSGAI